MTDKQKKFKNVIPIIEGALRSAASSFPVLASIATGWSEYKNHRQAENIESILLAYGQRLNELQGQIDKDFLSSEEAKRLIERTANLGKDENRDEKRRLLSEFLAQSTTLTHSSDPEKDMILDTIDKISPRQGAILKWIAESLVLSRGRENVLLGSDYNPDDPNKPVIGYIPEPAMVNNFKESMSAKNLEASLDYLQSIGVIETHSARGWTTVGGKMGVRGFRPTKLGVKLLEFLGFPIENMLELPPEKL